MVIGWEMWPLECSHCFSIIWRADLVFYPTWPIYQKKLGVIRPNILRKLNEVRMENVVSTVFTRFFYDLTWFRHNMTHTSKEARSPQATHSDKDSCSLDRKCGPRVFTRFFCYLICDLVFDVTWPFIQRSLKSSSLTFWQSSMLIVLEMLLLKCS